MLNSLRELAVYPLFVLRVIPLVKLQLRGWIRAAREIPDRELRVLALASIEKKEFHCIGGAVLALLDPGRLPALIRAIVAIQTISDYLDNLCDRSSVAAALIDGGADPRGDRLFRIFRSLHEAMLCAVDPERPTREYYAGYSDGLCSPPDGGYLAGLVEASRQVLRDLPGYRIVKPFVLDLVGLYSELQSIKHLSPAVRDTLMEQWWRSRRTGRWMTRWMTRGMTRRVAPRVSPRVSGYMPRRMACRTGGRVPERTPGESLARLTACVNCSLTWWEFGAAAGSTLGMFALICASSTEGFTLSRALAMDRAYFPVCGLHILLDYYIDRQEDIEGGDLNFVSRYSSGAEALKALRGFTRWSLSAAGLCLPHPHLHKAVVRGLLALYLSDPKVRRQGMASEARALLRAGGRLTGPLRVACDGFRRLMHF